MADKMEIDSFLSSYAKENETLVSSFTPDFGKIEESALWAVKKNSRRHAKILRGAAIAAAAFVVFCAGALFSDTGIVNAYKQRTQSVISLLLNHGAAEDTAVLINTAEIEKIQQQVPYQMLLPHWLPEGFSFVDASVYELGGDVFSATLRFKNDKGMLQIGYINDKTDGSIADLFAPNGQLEILDVRGVQVALEKRDKGEETTLRAKYIDKHGLLINIVGAIDKQAMLQLIAGLY